ncbi:hypothetical protein LV779_02375 [Streptomyces thinghirensis]|nr:hypothetical protein [Streptomyces thinghirensis]
MSPRCPGWSPTPAPATCWRHDAHPQAAAGQHPQDPVRPLTVLPVLPGGIRHEVSADELTGIGPGSSLVGVVEGHTCRVSDLWNGVFLNSGNDAVHVLASLTGGWSATAARMQAGGPRPRRPRHPRALTRRLRRAGPGVVGVRPGGLRPGGAAQPGLRAVLRQGRRDVPRPERGLVRDHQHQPAAHRGRTAWSRTRG